MCGEYCIFYNDQKVGTAVIRENGLYYNIQASSKQFKKEMLRLILVSETADVDLGLMVPCDGQFVLSKDLPKKRLGQGRPRFILRGDQETTVSICPEKPFSYLSNLEEAVLTYKAGRKYIAFRRSVIAPIAQDSDQSP